MSMSEQTPFVLIFVQCRCLVFSFGGFLLIVDFGLVVLCIRASRCICAQAGVARALECNIIAHLIREKVFKLSRLIFAI